MRDPSTIEWHGHRGCRGLLPENSIPAFLHAIELGMDALEMDVVISKDKQVVIAHEPYMPARICRLTDGQTILPEDEQEHNLFRMDYETIRSYDCGLPHPDYPEQRAQSVHRPLLSELFDIVADRFPACGIRYTIELKSKERTDNLFHPEPQEFVRLVLKETERHGLTEDCLFQSFDIRILEEFKQQAPRARIAYLLQEPFQLQKALDRLSFKPDVLGPHFSLVDQDLVDACHALDIAVTPWTVNESEDIDRMMKLGVDGIITDYPNRKP